MTLPSDNKSILPSTDADQSAVASTAETAIPGIPSTAPDPSPLVQFETFVPQELDRLGKYRISSQLGKGAMGAVYAAFDERLQRTVALKVMLPNAATSATSKERFLREARAAARISSDYVVSIYEADEIDGTPFIAQQHLQGCPLNEYLKKHGRPSLAQILRIGREAALGLAAAHQLGPVHRDIKPANLWLEAPDNRLKILDFGLAKPVEGGDGVELTTPGAVVGTPAYMAPEQAAGAEVDGRADLFSLGCVLYELVTGTKPFQGPSLTAVLYALANHTPPAPHTLNPSAPESLSRLIEQLLAKDREDRPATAAEVAVALQVIEKQLASPTATWPAPTQPQQQWQSEKHRRKFTIGCALQLTIVLGCLAMVSLISLFNAHSEREFTGTSGKIPTTTIPLPSAADPSPLRVVSLDVLHFASTPAGDVPKGILGKESFQPLLGDRVQVVAKLSRPAYAYLIAFRPDGEMELCFPDEADKPPPLTDTPRYPSTDSSKAYGLREGTGLWAFAVVASEQPLPAYTAWLAKQKLEWKRQPAPAGAIWWYDGVRLEPRFPDRNPTRAKDEDLTGPAAAVRSVGEWLKHAPETKSAVIGFGVGPRN